MKTIKISNQNDLRDYFGNKTLYLSKKSTIQFKGSLKLGNNIEFSGINVFGFNNKILSNCIFENVETRKNNYTQTPKSHRNKLLVRKSEKSSGTGNPITF